MALGTIPEAIGFWTRRQPDAVWVVEGDRSVTRGELDVASNRVARALLAAGVGPGSLVSVSLPNGIRFVTAVLGIWKAGGTPQLLSARMPAPERDALVALADAAVVIGVPADAYPGRWCLPPEWIEACDESGEPVPPTNPTAFHAPCSGSTGRPKIIVSGRPVEIDPLEVPPIGGRVEGCQLVVGPLYHNGPFAYGMSALLRGNKLVVMPRFDAATTVELIEAHRVDWVPLVPTMMQRIIKLGPEHLAAHDLSSLDAIMHFGAVCPVWLKQAWIDLIGPEKVLEIYGGAEGQAVCVITGEEWLTHPGSVGRPWAGRFRVLDEQGREVPPGVVGELYMMPDRGPGSTYRYIGATANRLDGWESLGDLGSIDADGWVYLADRRKDLIVSGGANIYPAEVEGVIDAIPEVVACAVVGVPDDDLGERVHAFVQASGELGPQEVMDWVASHLSRNKVPRGVTFVDEALRDEAGKVRRSELTRRFAHAMR